MDKNNSLTYLDLERIVLFVFLIIVAFRFAQLTAEILILFALVILLFLLLNPLVVWFEKKHIKRAWASILTVLSVLLAIVLILAFVLPPIINQINLVIVEVPKITNSLLAKVRQFSAQFPFLKNITSNLDIENILKAAPVFSGVAKVGQNLISLLFFSILGIFLVIFMLADPRPVITGLLQFFPKQKVFRVREGIILLSQGLARWFTSALIIGTINGATVFIGFSIIGVDFAFLFGILYVMAEFVPYIGPLAVAIVAILFTLSQSLTTALFAIIVLLTVQILEATVWSPLILSQRLNIHPVSVVFTVLVAEVLLGIIGALLAIPILLTIKVFYYEFYERPFPPGFLESEAYEVMEMELKHHDKRDRKE